MNVTIIGLPDTGKNVFIKFFIQILVATSNQSQNHIKCYFKESISDFLHDFDNFLLIDKHQPINLPLEFFIYLGGNNLTNPLSRLKSKFISKKNTNPNTKEVIIRIPDGQEVNKYIEEKENLFYDNFLKSISGFSKNKHSQHIIVLLVDGSRFSIKNNKNSNVYDHTTSKLLNNILKDTSNVKRKNFFLIVIFTKFDLVNKNAIGHYNNKYGGNILSVLGQSNRKYIDLINKSKELPALEYYRNHEREIQESGKNVLREYMPETNKTWINTSSYKINKTYFFYSWLEGLGMTKVLKSVNNPRKSPHIIRTDVGLMNIYPFHMYQNFVYVLWRLCER